MPEADDSRGAQTYLVVLAREQVAELTVEAADPVEAGRVAVDRVQAGEAVAWATGGGVAARDAQPVPTATVGVS